MTFQYQNNQTGDAFDITTMIKSAKWTTKRRGSPAKLELSVLSSSDVAWAEGGIVTMLDGGKGLFYGYVFKISRTEDEFVDIGTRFSGGEINYIITGALNTPGAYSLTSETPGEIGNGFYGTLLPIDFVDGLAGAELEDILIPGKDTESDDSLRERYFNSYDNQAFGGNQSDYKERVSALAGVGGVKVFRTPSGGGTVGLTIVDSEWSVPSSTLIASVQNAVDPLTDQGSGIGFAPIGHTVTVSGVTGRTINTKFKLTLENNVSWPDVQAAVTAAIRGYFQSLIKLWADSEAITVRISQIETRVLAVPGVLDVENTTLNAVGANIQLTGTEIPVLGEVSNGTA